MWPRTFDPKLTTRQSLQALADAGLTLQEATKRIGCSYWTTRMTAKALGIRFVHGNRTEKRNQQELTPQQEAELIAALEAALADVEGENA